MKITLHQINTIVGDFQGNIDKIVTAGRRSAQMGASLAIFPELSVTG
jgi:NAD+ synthase (glutamine-hydrolysing)